MATDPINWFVKEFLNKLSDSSSKNKRFFKREAKVNIKNPY